MTFNSYVIKSNVFVLKEILLLSSRLSCSPRGEANWLFRYFVIRYLKDKPEMEGYVTFIQSITVDVNPSNEGGGIDVTPEVEEGE